MPCQMPLACFILSDRRRKDAGPSVRRDSLPFFVDLCLKAHFPLGPDTINGNKTSL
jgi:hypothetical protein